jgi:hypothetical protein
MFWLFVTGIICFEVVLGVGMRKTISRFMDELEKSQFGKWFDSVLAPFDKTTLDGLTNIAAIFLVVLPILAFAVVFAPFIYVHQKNKDANRAKQREEWLSQNDLKLYYNEQHGIRVVATPEALTRLVEHTTYQRLDGLWKNPNFLDPRTQATQLVFVTAEGERKALSALPKGVDLPKLSALERLGKKYNITLAKTEELFVPCISREDIPLAEHIDHFTTEKEDGAIEKALVFSQMPEEIRPF